MNTTWARGTAALAAAGLVAAANAQAGFEQFDGLWKRVDAEKAQGDLSGMKKALDEIDTTLAQWIESRYLQASDTYAVQTRERVEALRRWLAPQLPHYEKLVSLAESVEKESWNLNLWEGGTDKLRTYGSIAARLGEAQKLADSFVQAFPGAKESRPVKKLAAARGNLDTERGRALTTWLTRARENLARDQAENRHASPEIAIDVLRARSIDPKSPDVAALIGELEAHRKAVHTARAKEIKTLKFPMRDLGKYAAMKDDFKAAYYARNPLTEVKKLSYATDPAQYGDPATGAIMETMAVLFGVRHQAGDCEVQRVWFARRQGDDGTFGPWAFTGAEALNPLECSQLAR